MSDSYGYGILLNPAARAAESAIQDAYSNDGAMAYLTTQDWWDSMERELYSLYTTPNGTLGLSIRISDSKIRTNVGFNGEHYSSAEYPLDVDPEVLIAAVFAEMDKASGVEPE